MSRMPREDVVARSCGTVVVGVLQGPVTADEEHRTTSKLISLAAPREFIHSLYECTVP